MSAGARWPARRLPGEDGRQSASTARRRPPASAMSVPVTAICAALVATTWAASCSVDGARPWPSSTQTAPGFSHAPSTAAGVEGPAAATTMSAAPTAARKSETSSTSRSKYTARSRSRTAVSPSGWVPKTTSRVSPGSAASRNGSCWRPWVPGTAERT